MPVGGRGPLKWSWFDAKRGRQSSEVRRWRHGLEAAEYATAREQLLILPEDCGPCVDDAGGFQIAFVDEAGAFIRSRAAYHLYQDSATMAFDRAWLGIVPRIHAELQAQAAPKEMVAGSSMPWARARG